MFRRRRAEALERLRQRRELEAQAPRLRSEVPQLVSLSLKVTEFENGERIEETVHIRRIVVEHAPALFLLSCNEKQCENGGHEVSADILEALKAGKERFEGEHRCSGQVGDDACIRTVKYVATAKYNAQEAAQSA